MRQVHIFALAAVLMLAPGLWSCAGSKDAAKHLPPSMATVKQAGGYLKKVAVTPIQPAVSELGSRLGKLFFDTLVRSMGQEDRRLLLITPDQPGFPEFMARLGQQADAPVNAMELAAQGRRGGYNGLIAASLRGIRPYTRKGGMLWFRKVRYFISFDLTVDLYDPLTAAKIVGVVEEASVEVSDIEYDAFKENAATDVEELREEIVDFAEEIGELVGEAIKDLYWATSVVNVEGPTVFLPVGERSGLDKGTKLAVFEGRRIVDGLNGESFIVPGLQVGTVQISSITPDGAQAQALDGDTFEVGDIVVPVR